MSALLGLAGILTVVIGGRWLLRAIVTPERWCWLCKGTGRNWWSGEGRRGKCWLCHGEPWRMTFGARLIRGQVRSKRWGR